MEPAHPKPAPDGLAYFDHVSLAVKDIAAAYKFFPRYFPGTKISHEMHSSNSQGNFDLGHIEVAGFKLEFIQSPAHKPDHDFVGKFIARYGEGMHHVTIDLKDFDTTRESSSATASAWWTKSQLARRASIFHLAQLGLRRADPNLGRAPMSDSDDQKIPPPATHTEPPKVYLATCGVLCDVFWWARRDPPAEETAPAPAPLPGRKL